MKTQPFLLHALSPLHIGVGRSADIIDLPIARQRATGIPYVPGSAIKGVLREERRPDETDSDAERDQWSAVFGPERVNDGDDSHAGAIVFGDALLLALPVRSFKGTFAFVTSPLLLRLAQRDLLRAPQAVPEPNGESIAVPSKNLIAHNERVYLEDLDLPAQRLKAVDDWATALANWVWPENPALFAERFVVAHDETMTFLWETATQLDTRVRINSETRTVAKGALWIEESLPSETVLLGLAAADQSRKRGVTLSPDDVLTFALPERQVAQFGGKATVGRGRCELLLVEQEAAQ